MLSLVYLFVSRQAITCGTAEIIAAADRAGLGLSARRFRSWSIFYT